MKTGITSFFYSFLGHIKKEKRKFAILQLVGRMEDYLVKEFIYHIYRESGGNRFALTNTGSKGEQKFDIAILSGYLKKPSITGLIEAKYLRNWHRAWRSDATDETTTVLKSLRKQLGFFSIKQQGNFRVKLASRSKDIYGLVFASYVCAKKDRKAKESFFKSQLENPVAQTFRYHDLRKAYFRSVYDDVRITVLGGVRYASLRVGLWKLIQR